MLNQLDTLHQTALDAWLVDNADRVFFGNSAYAASSGDLSAGLATLAPGDVIHSHHWMSGVAALPVAAEWGVPHVLGDVLDADDLAILRVEPAELGLARRMQRMAVDRGPRPPHRSEPATSGLVGHHRHTRPVPRPSTPPGRPS